MAGSTNFPSSLDSHTGASPLGMGEVNNQAYTKTTASHTNSVTTITVASTALFPAKGFIVVKRELISYTGTTATTFTGCTRGVGGTTAAAFLSGTLVEQVPVAANHNDLAAGLVAVETKLGITSSTPTANKVLGADGTGTSSWRQVATTDLAANAVTQFGQKTVVSYNDTTTSGTFVTMKGDNSGEDMAASITTTGGDIIAYFSGVIGNATLHGVNAVGFSLDGVNTTDLMAFTAYAAGAYGAHTIFYRWAAPSSGSHTVKVVWRVNSGTASAYGRQLIVQEVKR